ncbi:putative DEAD/H helicase [Natrialba chahannaoensis JCM 10990]|uniref:Putative DEAD/H helicase n=1 Tax=Natrialba chahannaoensis JCM 10990 TaxID=1227492 RepID=M0B7C0_9EURY|nr:helicase-related protein [Natrialba chahannaoensis]ELZ06168.1 putative DEAD/H helicase [Natrialba chahannaoensis JCM 10990]
MTLQDVSWEPVYESEFRTNRTLMETFYRPFLDEVIRYDRLAGYLSLRSLAYALEGVDSLLETDGTVRVIAGADLQKREKGAMFPDADEPLEPWVESQLTIIATLLDRGDLQIKVGNPKGGDGLFHPKLGIGVDREGNKISFEGSINETLSAWQYNYERFKVHRSWSRGEAKYVDEDISTFNALWNGFHPSVNVYPLDEAARQDLIEWKDTDGSLDEHVERVKNHDPQTTVPEDDTAGVVSLAGRTPGGIHLAEEISTVTPWPHQRTISDTAVSIYPNNLLFCDEVGLGKTIEAGLTLSRLMQIGEVENALFLVPAGLVQQWQNELLDRFNIHAYYHERSYDGDYMIGPLGSAEADRIPTTGTVDADDWENTPIGSFVTGRDERTVVIESWHTARRENNQEHVGPEIDEDVWDLTVVDEAHSAREETKLYDLLGQVEDVSQCLYALTATPMQLNIGELYDLLRLCDLPPGWDDKERFVEFFETRQALEDSLDTVGSRYQTLMDGQQQVLQQFRKELDLEEGEGRPRIKRFGQLLHEHLTSNPGYDDQANDLVDSTETASIQQRKALEKLVGVRETSARFDDPRSLIFDCGPTEWAALVEASQWATPVQSRIFRNTRAVLEQCQDLGLLDDTVPTRNVETKRIELGNAEPLYDQVEQYIDETYKQSQKVLTGKEKLALGFVMTTYRQRLTSSLHAIKQSLQRRMEKLDEKVEDMTEEVSELSKDAGVTEATIDESIGQASLDAYQPSSRGATDVVQAERAALQEFVDDLKQAHTDPKVAQLRRDIRSLRQSARDNIIIFTQYHDTLEHTRETLTDTHPNVGTYSGGGGMQYDETTGEWVNVGKEAIKRDFTDGDTNILICTDSASEGLNLQTADALINFDLPWNPMRVEQRIGRIDRIGQKNKVVKIINYAYKDSIDGDIYEELEGRLQLFENVVGPMRPVLNSIEQDIKEAVMGSSDTSDSQEPSKQVVEEADSRAQRAQQKAEETGLAGEEDSVATKEAIIESAGLDGWEPYCYPAFDEIGTGDRSYEPLVSLETIETLLTQSNELEEAGWTFTALRNHARAEDFDGIVDDAYVLELPDDSVIRMPESLDETAQAELGDGNGIVITFNPKIAEQLPSIRLLLPGDPLFEALIREVTPEVVDSLEFICGKPGPGGSSTTRSSRIAEITQAAVVEPAVTSEAEKHLLGGTRPISDPDDAEQTVLNWLSELPAAD